jgi:two-component system phosphate regulon sensor histidine kinase PhoR
MWYPKPLSRNQLLIALMVSSLLLLSGFMAWWLRRSFREQKQLLVAEASQPFFRSVMGLQDSLITQKVLRPMQAKGLGGSIRITMAQPRRDSLFRPPQPAFFRYIERRPGTPPPVGRRPVFFGRGIPAALARIGPDSLRDSLKIKELSIRYQLELDTSALRIRYSVFRMTAPPPRHSDTLFTNAFQAGLPPDHFYVARIEDYVPLVLKRMVPQILFSVFLLGLTTVAFVLVFRSLRAQQKLTAMKNDFISNITHELKTPISTVSVAIEALSHFDALKDPERTREYLAISKTELNRLNLLVDKVLKTALFDQQRIAYHFETLPLVPLIQEVLDSLRVQFEKTEADVRFQHGTGTFSVSGDRVHLMNVLYNLLDNALKYSRSRPNICLSLTDIPQGIRLQVQDQGIGIEPEYQLQVFEKFFRVPTGDVHNVKGYGLGLSYVHQIITGHGGTIRLDSEPGRGSTFEITFPHHG